MADTEMTETEDYDKSAIPTLHHTTHELSGIDEVDVSGLIHKSTFNVYLSPDQSIPHNSSTLVQYSTAVFDRNNDFSFVTYRFTAPADGKYLLSCQAYLASLAPDKYHRILIYKNGSPASSFYLYVPISTGTSCIASIILHLSENDYVEIKVKHNHGSARTLTGLDYYNYFYGTRLY